LFNEPPVDHPMIVSSIIAVGNDAGEIYNLTLSGALSRSGAD